MGFECVYGFVGVGRRAVVGEYRVDCLIYFEFVWCSVECCVQLGGYIVD